MYENILNILKVTLTRLSTSAVTPQERVQAQYLLAVIALEEERELQALLDFFSKPERTLNDVVKEADEAQL